MVISINWIYRKLMVDNPILYIGIIAQYFSGIIFVILGVVYHKSDMAQLPTLIIKIAGFLTLEWGSAPKFIICYWIKSVATPFLQFHKI